MNKRTLGRRLADLRRQATAKRVGPIVLVDTLTWPDEDRIAYIEADECGDKMTCDALIEKHHGPLPDPDPDSDGVTHIVVVGRRAGDRLHPPMEDDNDEDKDDI